MLTKTQTLAAIQKSLIKYNDLVANQIDSKINAHNTIASTTANGHMSSNMVTKLNGIADGAEVNQNAISKIKIGDNTVAAAGKESTATFKGSNGISVSFDKDNAIEISGADATNHTHSGYAPVSHTHNYAGSSTAGGVATQAAKTTGTLTIQTNGTSAGTFNGSANKTINITPANIGAATSSHTHNNYATNSVVFTIQNNVETLQTDVSTLKTQMGDVESILREINGE